MSEPVKDNTDTGPAKDNKDKGIEPGKVEEAPKTPKGMYFLLDEPDEDEPDTGPAEDEPDTGPAEDDDGKDKDIEPEKAEEAPKTPKGIYFLLDEPEEDEPDTGPAEDEPDTGPAEDEPDTGPAEDDDGKDKDIEPEKAEKAPKTPKGIYFLLGSEFGERFSFYGMHTILILFLHTQLLYSENRATVIYHGFHALFYFTPLFGAILSNSWLGKFRTIFYVSILYAIGNIVLSVGAIPRPLRTMKAVSFFGLFIISLGTGGIKPCASAFGGDQFKEGQEEKRIYFFSLFYIAIHFGKFLSAAITPALRGDISCFGRDTCYSLAFFTPAVLFVIALIVFLIGRLFYVIKPAEGIVFVSVFKCIGHALFRKATVKGEKKEHWLDYAEDKYDKNLIYDIKCLLKVLFIFLPLPIFWALYQQQGSTWVLQGSKMERRTFKYFIKPDHMQVVNPFFILILIPVFENFIYPWLAKCNIFRGPLQRMVIGGLLCSFSFVIAAIIERKLESEIPVIPPEGYSSMLIVNNSPCNLDARKEGFTGTIGEFSTIAPKENEINKSVEFEFTPTGCSVEGNGVVKKDWTAKTMYETMMVTIEKDALVVHGSNDSRKKDKDGFARVRLFFTLEYEFSEDVNATFFFQGPSNLYIIPDNMTRPGKIGMTDYCLIKPGEYNISLPSNDGPDNHEATPFDRILLKSGGSYIIYIFQSETESLQKLNSFKTVKPNSLHILWQIPQGIIITAGEVMFSITGLIFCYSEAPVSLKSILLVAWLLTISAGNLLVVVLVHIIDFEKMSYLFIMFAVLMALSMVVFAIMAYFYKYVKKRDDSEEYD